MKKSFRELVTCYMWRLLLQNVECTLVTLPVLSGFYLAAILRQVFTWQYFDVLKVYESYFQKRKRRQEQCVRQHCTSYRIIRRELPSFSNFSFKYVTCNRLKAFKRNITKSASSEYSLKQLMHYICTRHKKTWLVQASCGCKKVTHILKCLK